jgi:hypothetical protein
VRFECRMIPCGVREQVTVARHPLSGAKKRSCGETCATWKPKGMRAPKIDPAFHVFATLPSIRL